MRTTVVVLACASACLPTYAPPVRTMHGGAPGRLDTGDMEVAGGPVGLFVGPPTMGGGAIGWAARDHLVVEGGVDGGQAWTMSRAGVRVPGQWWVRPRIAVSVDGEVGAGIGLGGELCDDDEGCDPDGRAWHERLAGGGYLGAGAAVRFAPVSIYARTRSQFSDATNIPATHWVSAFGGLHFHILRHADIWLGAGFARYDNRHDSVWGNVWEAGLAFRFDPRTGWRTR